jgi:hypothetical protein
MTLASMAPLSAVRVASEVTELLEGFPVDDPRLPPYFNNSSLNRKRA